MVDAGGEVKEFVKRYLTKLQLPQFMTRRDIEGSFHLFEKNKINRYNVIIVRDLQQTIRVDILNSRQTFEWMGITVPMTQMGHWNRKLVTNFWETKTETNK